MERVNVKDFRKTLWQVGDYVQVSLRFAPHSNQYLVAWLRHTGLFDGPRNLLVTLEHQECSIEEITKDTITFYNGEWKFPFPDTQYRNWYGNITVPAKDLLSIYPIRAGARPHDDR